MKQKARQIIKSELAKKDVNYVKLAKLLQDKGYKENADSIRTKINRGSFSFAYILEVCEVLNLNIVFQDTNKTI